MRIVTNNRLYVITHPMALSMGAFAAVTGLVFFLFPSSFDLSQSSIGRLLPTNGMDTVWAALHCLSGCFVVYGIVRARPRFEASGFVVLGASLAINAAAIVVVAGGSGLISASTIAAGSVGCLVRAIVLTIEGARASD